MSSLTLQRDLKCTVRPRQKRPTAACWVRINTQGPPWRDDHVLHGLRIFLSLPVLSDETPTQETGELARVQEVTTKTLHSDSVRLA
jgi:hypothetical protein